MSFFNRQLGKQKPQAWGPVECVQAAVRENAEKIYGIDPGLIQGFWPCWESAGKTTKNIITSGDSTFHADTAWRGNNLRLSDIPDYVETDVYPDSIGTWIVFFKYNNLSESQIHGPHDGNSHRFYIGIGRGDDTASYIGYGSSYKDRGNSHLTQPNEWNVWSLVGDGSIGTFYINDRFVDSVSGTFSGASSESLSFGYRSSDINWHGADIGFSLYSGDVFSVDTLTHLSDHPYGLLYPITRRFYSIPDGAGGVISAACSDGFTFADTATKTAILQAAAVESINLSDSDENVAQFIAALVDSFTIADVTGSTAKYPVSVSDAFSISDATTALQKTIALVSTNVTFSDVSVVRADLAGIAEDNVQFSETLLAALQAQAIVTEIINLSDITTSRADLTAQATEDFTVSAITTADVLGVLIGLCSDTFNVSDVVTSRADLLSAITDALGLTDIASALLTTQAQATDSFSLNDSSTWASIAAALVADGFVITGEVTCRADLVAELVDSMNLSGASAAILTAYATADDEFTISDTSFWAGITQAIASDSFTVSGSVTGLIKLLAQAAETINFSDSGSVTAAYNVQVNDAVEFATAISTIAQLRAAVADGFNVTATPMEVSQLPNGKVSVSFSMKVPGADFSIKTATVVFNIK